MKTRIGIALAAALLFLGGCTQQQRVKSLGGSMTVDLPAGQKLVHVTWKETQIWYLTRPAQPGEKPEKLTFKEQSTYGVVEGTVFFQEH